MVKVFRAYRDLTESEQRGAGHRGYVVKELISV